MFWIRISKEIKSDLGQILVHYSQQHIFKKQGERLIAVIVSLFILEHFFAPIFQECLTMMTRHDIPISCFFHDEHHSKQIYVERGVRAAYQRCVLPNLIIDA